MQLFDGWCGGLKKGWILWIVRCKLFHSFRDISCEFVGGRQISDTLTADKRYIDERIALTDIAKKLRNSCCKQRRFGDRGLEMGKKQ